MVEAKAKELAVMKYKELYSSGSRDVNTLFTEGELTEHMDYLS